MTTLWPDKPCVDPTAAPTTLPRFSRYVHHLKPLFDALPSQCVVGIEHYSYDSRHTPAQSDLMEVGTLLRAYCHEKHWSVLEIPPSTVKKAFSSSGKASKKDMVRAWESRYFLPSLYPLLGLDEQRYTEPPHPLEDMVDALAVALTTLQLAQRL